MTVVAWLVGSKLGRYVALGLLFAAALGVLVWRIYAAGAAKERARQAEAALNALRTRIKVDDDISKLSDAQRRERLNRWVRDDE